MFGEDCNCRSTSLRLLFLEKLYRELNCKKGPLLSRDFTAHLALCSKNLYTRYTNRMQLGTSPYVYLFVWLYNVNAPFN